MKNIYFLFLLLCLVLPARMAAAAPEGAGEVGIVAVVNDEPISIYDISTRLALIVNATKLANNPAAQQRLIPQILQNLVTEKLYLQEAKRLGIEIPDKDVEHAMATVATNNNIDPAAFRDKLTQDGIDIKTLQDKLRANMAWQALVQRHAGPLGKVSAEEVTEVIDDIEAKSSSKQFRYAEIFLPVEDVTNDKQVKDSAEEMFEQLKKGANFPKMAKLFSRSPSAKNGGDTGWVEADELPDDLVAILNSIDVGYLTKPVRLETGYIILLAIDKRTVQAEDVQVPSRQQVAFNLRRKKLETVARKYSHDLRREAIIDIRISKNKAAINHDDQKGS